MTNTTSSQSKMPLLESLAFNQPRHSLNGCLSTQRLATKPKERCLTAGLLGTYKIRNIKTDLSYILPKRTIMMQTLVQPITKRALLVDFDVKQWTAAKNDKKISNEVANNHHSDVS